MAHSSFNPSIGGKSNKRNFTHVEPKGAYQCTESWWIQPTRGDFIVRRDTELPRMLHAKAILPTAESGNSARQTFVQRARKHPALDWLPSQRIGGAE